MENSNGVGRRALRYIIMFMILFTALTHIPETPLGYNDAFIVATMGVVTFCTMDMFYPTVSIQKTEK